ncbi:52 kDa repressor of the inhibitor of the protein kinase-like [Hydra vulgaris]|uniref:52 kDa repressor of the inhibitor of the protein kinase-like n=1 Tax=Hydra vulgaris TaxID=6087 RepID=UPI0032E9C191
MEDEEKKKKNNKNNVIKILKAIIRAIENGNLEQVKYLHKLKYYYEELAINYATENYDFELEQQLYKFKYKYEKCAISSAAINGHFEVVKYLLEIGYKVDKLAISYAAINNHFEILKYLHELGYECYDWTIDCVAKNGHLEILKYLHELGYKGTEDAIDKAARNGHLEVIKYLHELGYKGTKDAIDKAAENGHLEMLKYLHELGYKGTNWAINNAAENGHLESGTFQHNYYVPLIFIPKKRKLSSKSKTIISKKLLPVLSPNKSVLSEVRKNVFFSIIADEACDSSTKEQMSLVLRFVDSDFNIREDFIQFIHCSEGVKGKDLFNVFLNCVSNLNLDIKNCRGQGYDGASSVSGYINGLSAQVLNINSKALYTHCHSHRLNLSVRESCNVHLVSESENLKRIKKKLKDICRTRWIECIDGLNTFLEHYLSIFHALCIIASPESSVNKDTQNKSSTFLNSIGTFQFVFTLVVTTRVFDFTLRVTRLLKSKTIDILDSLHLITALKNTFISIRNDIDSFHNNFYEAAYLLSSKAEIFVLKPRTCSIQKNRFNVPYESVSEYFKRAVTVPLIDHVSTSISTRFKSETVATYKGLSIIPFNIISFLKRLKTQLCWRKQFETFCDFYIDDFPNISALNGELVLWEKYWESFSGTIPDNISLTLKMISFPGFENIKIASRILGTLPVTSCECEMSFSVMRRLKDYMRTTMSEDRLNGLALMYIHQEIIPCIGNISKRKIKYTKLQESDFKWIQASVTSPAFKACILTTTPRLHCLE